MGGIIWVALLLHSFYLNNLGGKNSCNTWVKHLFVAMLGIYMFYVCSTSAFLISVWGRAEVE